MTERKQPDPPARPQAGRDDEHHEGTNAVEHTPDPKAQPLPDSEHKFIEKSPYTAGSQ